MGGGGVGVKGPWKFQRRWNGGRLELADIFFFQTSSMLSFCLFATMFLSQGLEKAIAQKRCKMIWHLIGIIILIYSVLCDQEKAGQGTDGLQWLTELHLQYSLVVQQLMRHWKATKFWIYHQWHHWSSLHQQINRLLGWIFLTCMMQNKPTLHTKWNGKNRDFWSQRTMVSLFLMRWKWWWRSTGIVQTMGKLYNNYYFN